MGSREAPGNDAAGERLRQDRIAAAQVDLVYKSAPSGFVATFVVGLLIVVATWDAIPHVALCVWLGGATCVSAARFLTVRAYRRRGAGASISRWRNIFTAGAFGAGTCWGILGSVLFPASHPLHQMVIGFAIGGMVGGATAYLCGVSAAYVAYAVSAVLPFATRLCVTGEITQVSMGVMAVAFAASMIAVSRTMHATMTDNIVLRIDKEDVVLRLDAEQAHIAKQAVELEQRARELSAAHEEALSGSRAKSAFLATMSHEIRTPLNAVIGMADLVARTNLSEEQLEYVATIQSSGENLLALLSDILDFSKLEAGKVEIDEVAFDLSRCIEEAIDVVAPSAAKKRLELLCDVSERAPARIRSDPTRLRQILLNLLSNAVKFTETGNIRVTVDARPLASATPDDVELEVSVRDDGVGIPKEKLGRLFRSFSQVDASTTRQFGGTGLGLAICQALVTMLGGTIGVESEPGEGSTFTFTIRAKLAHTTKTDDVPRAVRGKRVALFVDREPVRALLEKWLARWGAVVSEGSFDAAIVDTGDDADAEPAILRARSLSPHAAIVVLAPLGKRSGSAPDVGGDGVATVSKPAKPTRLLRALARALASGAPAPARSSSAGPSVSTAVPRRLRVLVAEDNAVNQLVEQRMLEQLGHTVDIVENGLRALSALRQRPYDVVLLDMQMPELDGLGTAAKILEEWPEADRPRIIALTASAIAGDRERCLAAGMDDYLTKPIRRDALEAALRGTLETLTTAATSATTQGGLLDRAVIEDLRSVEAHSGTRLLADLVETFLRDAPELIAGVDRALAEGDLETAGRMAHSLKGSAAALGVVRVAIAAAHVQDAATTGDLEATARRAEPLLRALTLAEPALRRVAGAPRAERDVGR